MRATNLQRRSVRVQFLDVALLAVHGNTEPDFRIIAQRAATCDTFATSSSGANRRDAADAFLCARGAETSCRARKVSSRASCLGKQIHHIPHIAEQTI